MEQVVTLDCDTGEFSAADPTADDIAGAQARAESAARVAAEHTARIELQETVLAKVADLAGVSVGDLKSVFGVGHLQVPGVGGE